MALIAAPFAWNPNAERFLWPLAVFGLAAEWLLKQVTTYHGQDSIQWPLIIANSAIYGAIFAVPAVWVRRREIKGAEATRDVDDFLEGLR